MSSLDVLVAVLKGLPWTVGLTLASFGIGAVLALPLLAARQSKLLVFRLVASILVLVVRGVPPLVWLFIIFFGLGMGYMRMSPFSAALIGLSLIAAANMAEIYRGALASIHAGQWEAARGLNLGTLTALKDVILPQAFRVALPSAASYLIGLMKETAVASTIGVTDLAFFGNQVSQTTFRGLEVFAIVGLIYVGLSLPVAWASRTADRRLRARVAM